MCVRKDARCAGTVMISKNKCDFVKFGVICEQETGAHQESHMRGHSASYLQFQLLFFCL